MARSDLAPTELDHLLSDEGWPHASSTPDDEDDPGRFHALFGRDSLIVSLQVLRRRPEVAVATLRALAARQGSREDAETEEQPGRILHEDRPVAPAWLAEAGFPVRDGAMRYFGSADSTSWFLVVLDALGDAALAAELSPARAAAGSWLERALADGGGLVRSTARPPTGGLAQKGWRDASDPGADEHGGGIVDEQGGMPPPPLADADSQAAAVAALDALVRLDPDRREHWQQAARALRERVTATFLPDVMAVDGRGRLVPGAGSQLGWLLWAQALAPAAAEAAAQRLVQPDVLTAYGVRTLSSDHPAFLPAGYHRGAIWPFDCWLAWGGLRAAGREREAEQVRDGVRRALAELGRFPELYSVTASGDLRGVPIANRVQAWTVGAVIAFDDDWDGRA